MRRGGLEETATEELKDDEVRLDYETSRPNTRQHRPQALATSLHMPPRKSKGKKAAAETKGRKSTTRSKAAPQQDPELPVDAPSEQPSSQAPQEALPSTVGEIPEFIENALGDTVTPAAPQEPSLYRSMPVDEPESRNLPPPPAEPVNTIRDVEMGATGAAVAISPPTPPPTLTLEERQAKLEALRGRMVC